MLRKQDDGDRQVVHVIPKSPKLEIRASLSTFHGKQFLDLRTFVASRAGEFVPTRLGITLPPVFPPAGNYLGCVVDNGIVYVGGHGPIDGENIIRGQGRPGPIRRRGKACSAADGAVYPRHVAGRSGRSGNVLSG